MTSLRFGGIDPGGVAFLGQVILGSFLVCFEHVEKSEFYMDERCRKPLAQQVKRHVNGLSHGLLLSPASDAFCSTHWGLYSERSLSLRADGRGKMHQGWGSGEPHGWGRSHFSSASGCSSPHNSLLSGLRIRQPALIYCCETPHLSEYLERH